MLGVGFVRDSGRVGPMSFRRTAISICIACLAVLVFSERADASTFLLGDIIDPEEIATTATDTVGQTVPVTPSETEHQTNETPLSTITNTVSNVTEPVVSDVVEPVAPSPETVTPEPPETDPVISYRTSQLRR